MKKQFGMEILVLMYLLLPAISGSNFDYSDTLEDNLEDRDGEDHIIDLGDEGKLTLVMRYGKTYNKNLNLERSRNRL